MIRLTETTKDTELFIKVDLVLMIEEFKFLTHVSERYRYIYIYIYIYTKSVVTVRIHSTMSSYPDAVLNNAGRIRITIDSSNIKAEYVEAVQHYLGDWESLVWSAMEIGVSYKTWYVSFEVIPLNKIESIELWKDNE